MKSAQFQKIWSRSLDIGYYAFGPIIAIAIFWLLSANQENVQRFLFSKYARESALSGIERTLGDFMTLTLSIIIEALPFIVLGVLISVCIQTFLSTQQVLQRLPKNRLLRRSVISFLGVAMPVCECGNVPVARSLMMRGLTVQEAIVFLLCAPSVNIITFIVTWEAFNFNHAVAVWRVVATLVIANIVAVFLTKYMKRSDILTDDFQASCKTEGKLTRSVGKSLRLFRTETWQITRLLIIGAMIAAASQTLISRDAITAIGANVALSVIAMLILAFVISICSNVDAFFALAYVNVFSLGSIVAFLIAGPMVDIKMLTLMKTTFTLKATLTLAAMVLILTFIVGLGASYVL